MGKTFLEVGKKKLFMWPACQLQVDIEAASVPSQGTTAAGERACTSAGWSFVALYIKISFLFNNAECATFLLFDLTLAILPLEKLLDDSDKLYSLLISTYQQKTC